MLTIVIHPLKLVLHLREIIHDLNTINKYICNSSDTVSKTKVNCPYNNMAKGICLLDKIFLFIQEKFRTS